MKTKQYSKKGNFNGRPAYRSAASFRFRAGFRNRKVKIGYKNEKKSKG